MTSVTRRRFLQTSSAALLFASFPGLGRAAQRSAFTIEELSGGVGIFKAQGGTIAYLIDEAGVALVDSQFPRTAGICLAEMRKRSDKPIEFVDRRTPVVRARRSSRSKCSRAESATSPRDRACSSTREASC